MKCSHLLGLFATLAPVFLGCSNGTKTTSASSTKPPVSRPEKQSTGFNIQDGAVTNLHEPVGILHDVNGTLCSAVEIGPRCILTAAHCIVSQGPLMYSQESAPFTDLDHVKGTVEMRSPLVHPHYAGGNSPFDLALIWMDGLECDGPFGMNHPCWSSSRYDDNAPNVSTAQWQPATVRPEVEDFDVYDQSQAGTRPVVVGVGYGQPAPSPSPSSSPDSNAHAHKKRSFGFMNYSQTVLGPELADPEDQGATMHGIFAFGEDPNDPVPRIVGGDSGGGIFYEGDLVATISTSSLFNFSATRYLNSNEDFVTDVKAKYCRPKLNVGVSVDPAGAGIVSGQPSDPLGEYDYDWQYDCATLPYRPGEVCGSQEPIIKVTLSAAAEPGYVFDEWDPETNCPCAGGGDPECAVDADTATLAQEYYGITCTAVFKPAPSDSPSPTPTESPEPSP